MEENDIVEGEKEYEEHVHCLICSAPKRFYSEDQKRPDVYICEDCEKTFSAEYLAHRIDCFFKGIYKREFDILEYRLTFGATRKLPKDFLIDREIYTYGKD